MPHLRKTSPRRVAGLVAASAALLFPVAACSGGSDTPATGDAAPGADFAAYTQCLARNGVTITVPSAGTRARPSGAPGGMPSGGPGGMPRPSGSARPGGGGFPGGGLPGGGFGKPADVDQATWDKAQQSCASVRPSGRPGGRGNGNGNGNGMSAAYRNCLQDNGVTLGQGGLATGDPAVAKAIETCKPLAPAGSAGPS